MCCRYWTEESPELRPIVEEMNRSPLMKKWQGSPGIITYGEVRPTNIVPVVAPDRSGKKGSFSYEMGIFRKAPADERAD